VLRLAKNKKILDENDYSDMKKSIFQKGKDAREVKRELTSLIRQRQELEPEEAWEKRKFSTVRRFLGVLKALKTEIEQSKLLPAPLIKEAAVLIKKLEEEI
jgi:dsDNA-specific endonuclease/ATPase MutS2